MPISQLRRPSTSPSNTRSVEEIRKEMLRRYNLAPRGSSPKRQQPKKKLLRRLISLAVIFVLLMAILAFGALAWYSKDLPSPNKIINRAVAQSTKIYDRTGETVLYEIHGDQKRTMIDLNQIPPYAIQATIAIEDKNFYKHQGFSFWGFARAIVFDVLRGSFSQGGSTLTQQFVKNAILTNEKRISRKIKELVLSYEIEKKFSKDEILKMYFNEIPYGSTAYGIESAAQLYFGKSAKDLTMGEGAILAAMTQAPTYYSPYGNHVEELMARQKMILDLMVAQKYISKDQAETAKNEKLNFKKQTENIKAPHFVFYVKELLTEKYGERLVEQGGLKVITSLDWEKQKIAEEEVTKQSEKNLKYNAENAALISLDVKTGQVLAMVGSKDFFNEEIDGQVNVTLAKRQPGSSFKPIVYAEAFELGYVPESMMFDLTTSFAGGGQSGYTPHNYTGKEYGPVTLRQALAGSLNITSVKLLYLVGLPKAIALANNFGYTTLTKPDTYGLSLVLGGGEIKLLEHANAFGVFARDGIYKPVSPVLKVEDNTGATLEEFEDKQGQRALSETSSRMISSILSDNNARTYIFGANNYLTLSDRSVAAKTGTTNDNKDAWTVGYTPSLVTGVWVGNSGGKEMKAGADGSVVAAPIWRNYMQRALQGQPAEGFIAPGDYPKSNKPMIGGSLEQEQLVKIDKTSGLLANENTPANQIIEKSFKQVHDILQYVNKDDPLGPAPTNPENDPYYWSFENPVKAWAEKQGYNTDQPPTTYDNIHRLEDKPSITITSPSNNQTISDNTININIQASAPRGLKKVEYYLDDQLINSVTSNFFSQSIAIPINITNGNHQLKVYAYDDLNNNNYNEVTINLNRQDSLVINWLSPSSGATLHQTDFPYELIINLSSYDQIKKADFYYRDTTTNQSTWLGYKDNPQTNNLSVYWTTPPSPGIYKLYTFIQALDGTTFNGPETTISLE